MKIVHNRRSTDNGSNAIRTPPYGNIRHRRCREEISADLKEYIKEHRIVKKPIRRTLKQCFTSFMDCEFNNPISTALRKMLNITPAKDKGERDDT